MAQPYEITRGRWAYEFSFNGKRLRLRLGKMPGKRRNDQFRSASAFASKVDELRGQLETGSGLLQDHQRFLAGLSDKLHGRLTRVLPLANRVVSRLGAFVDHHIETRPKLSDGGRRKLKQTRFKLVEFFGESKEIRSITESDGDAWRTWLLKSLSEATVKTHCGNAKGIFADAVKQKIIAESPMAQLSSGSTPRGDAQYVERATIQQVIHAIPADQLELKLRLALCRFAGLRVDSEPKSLVWSRLDFAAGKMIVYDQKRKRDREIPIDAQLLPYLQARHAERKSGELNVCRTEMLNGWHKEVIERAIADAGVARWADLFQSLRASYDTDVRLVVGDAAADAIVGHTTSVARKHYNRNMPDSVFDKLGVKWNPEAAQKAAHPLRESSGSEGNDREADPRYQFKIEHQGESAGIEGNKREWAMRGLNPRPHGCDPCALAS